MAKHAHAISKMLVVSTAHLTQETADQLSAESLPVASYPNEYGGFVYVPTDPIDREAGLTEDIAAVFKLARALHCEWVKLDRDAPELDGLKIYEW